MEIIKSVKIRKFRSLKSVTKDVELTHLNIFVGQNDKGKSNFLRALNLFFNNQTDLDSRFRFEEDYCYHSNTGKGTSREIRIDLEIHPPKGRFKHAKPLRWIKRWKQDGSIVEERRYIESGELLSQRDNVSKWLDKIRYRYVPAIKGQSYFAALMGELHDVLNEAHAEILKEQGETFISGIQEVTKSISSDLKVQLGISNTIQVPSDFKLLFSNLDFGEKVGENTYHLKQRGDGIKIRHIPVILKYMSEQERNISRAGYVKPDTIWGFEEPENNLELKFAFELAESFKQYSEDLQIIISTHSPAFYALDKTDKDGVTTFFVSQGEDSCSQIRKVKHTDADTLHETMGLLPLITPYLSKIVEGQKEIDRLESELAAMAIPEHKKCIVLTEDENHKHVSKYFELNGFRPEETEYFSYKGASQITGALVLARYLAEKHPSITIIIHRDRDYLTDDEVAELDKKVEKAGFKLFITDGVDIESQYLNPHHVHQLYPALEMDVIIDLIAQATSGAEKESMDRLIDYDLTKTPKGSSYAKRLEELNGIYESNPERYRYGKKVCGLLRASIQQQTACNADLYRETEFVKNEKLQSISGDIWLDA